MKINRGIRALALLCIMVPPFIVLLAFVHLVMAQTGVPPLLDLNGPTVTGMDYSTNYTEDGPPSAIVSSTALTIVDSDSTNLSSATIRFNPPPPDGNLESLAADPKGTGITVQGYNSNQARLRLTGNTSVAAYQEVMRTLTYLNTSQSPDPTDRKIELFVVDSDGNQSATAVSTVIVHPVNDAPVLDNSGDMVMTPINEDEVNSPGNAVGTIIKSAEQGGADRITDVDKNALEGFAVIEAASANGTWQYLADGGSSWLPFTGVSNESAVLLNTGARIRFVPNPGFSGSVSFTFRAWDQTSGSNGETGVNVSGEKNGGKTAFSTATETVALTVLTVNDLPIVDLNGPEEGRDYRTSFAENSSPVPIASSSATVSDEDSTLLARMVVMLTDALDGEAEMLAANTLTTSITAEPYNPETGVLLLNGPDTVSNFQLVLRQIVYNHTMPEPSSGNRVVFVVANDGENDSQPVSSTIAVNLINTAPVLNASGTYRLSDIPEDTAEPAGNAVQEIIASAGGDPITDPDPDAEEGIAVTGVNDSNGRWQYTTGTTWLDFGVISDTAAVLLNAAARIRYLPNPNYNGPAGNLTFRAWDLTTGANGQRNVDVSRNGGSTAFSNASAVATLTVTPVNDRPSATLTDNITPTYVEDAAPVPLINGTLQLSDVDNPLLSSATLTITNLLDAGAEWLLVDTSGTNIVPTYHAESGVLRLAGQTTLANYTSVLRTVAYRNSSQDPTEAERSIEMVVSDATLSSTAVVLNVAVQPVNDPPVVDLNGAGSGIDYVGEFIIRWGPAPAVDQNLSVVDVDNTTLTGAVVKIVNPQNGEAERLTADTSATPNITRVFDPDTHELHLTGTDSVANYQLVLRTVRYNNLLDSPNMAERRIEFVLTDGSATSAVAKSTLHIRETPISLVYLPVLTPARGDEPNNSCPEALSINTNHSYSFLPNDENDWYYFDLAVAQDVTVELTNFVPRQGQIVIASGSSTCQGLQLVGNNGNNQTEKIVDLGTRPPGRYFIWIITDGTFNNTVPYNLLVRTE